MISEFPPTAADLCENQFSSSVGRELGTNLASEKPEWVTYRFLQAHSKNLLPQWFERLVVAVLDRALIHICISTETK